jgi:OOP family OmpA-OmpF porin
MKKIILFFVVLLTMGSVNSGLCQITPGMQSITPYVGGTTFEGNLDLDTNPVYGLKLGYDFTRYFGAEIVLGFIRTHYTEPVNEIKTNVFNYRIEGLYYFMPDSRLVPYAAAGIGAQLTNYRRDVKDKARFVADYGLGVKYYWTKSMALRADVRHILASGSIYNNLEYTLGLSFLFGGAKPAPAPVAIAKPAPAPVAIAKPAPPAPAPLAAPLGLSAVAKSDSEINLNWNCVANATGYRVFRDGAYVFPAERCSAADTELDADTRYCYQVAATDDGGRESALSNQDCAKTPAAPVVPVAPVKELKKPAESAAAAAIAKQIIEKGRATINIKFDFDKSVVKPQYHQELAKFAEVLQNHPEVKLIIEGHTDDVGKDEYNQKLSERRAESVRAYLVQKFGIAEDRLTAKGYGEARPVYDNRVAVGRAKNRRVEAVANFTITK